MKKLLAASLGLALLAGILVTGSVYADAEEISHAGAQNRNQNRNTNRSWNGNSDSRRTSRHSRSNTNRATNHNSNRGAEGDDDSHRRGRHRGRSGRRNRGSDD